TSSRSDIGWLIRVALPTLEKHLLLDHWTLRGIIVRRDLQIPSGLRPWLWRAAGKVRRHGCHRHELSGSRSAHIDLLPGVRLLEQRQKRGKFPHRECLPCCRFPAPGAALGGSNLLPS